MKLTKIQLNLLRLSKDNEIFFRYTNLANGKRVNIYVKDEKGREIHFKHKTLDKLKLNGLVEVTRSFGEYPSSVEYLKITKKGLTL